MYDEQENFQSADILVNFNYPFANRKQVKDEYYAQIPLNSTTQRVENHKLYFQNSVVCLQENWWNAFSFVGSSYSTFFKYLLRKIRNEERKIPAVNYQCGNPFVKLKLAKSQMAT